MPKKEEKDVIREKKQISTEKLRRVRIRSALAEPWALKKKNREIIANDFFKEKIQFHEIFAHIDIFTEKTMQSFLLFNIAI